ncbi:MAG: (d)CMP kinase [Clostridia bacterium]|nr:(d)CMP kinase [Clostridia bacterium]
MFAIAIDGPAAAGKSSTAQSVARELGMLHVDTGALYRAVAYYVDAHPETDLDSALSEMSITVRHENGRQRTILDQRDVSDMIRSEKIGDLASKLSDHTIVRQYLLDTQRNVAREHDVVMDGRDIGTVILPDADLKIFLTASLEERAKRRMLQLGLPDLGQVTKEIRQRDRQDAPRLRVKAPDAVILDSTFMEPENVTKAIVKMARHLMDKSREQGKDG